VRKLTFAIAVLASLGGASLATSASAAPGAPMGVTAPETVSTVQMTRYYRPRAVVAIPACAYYFGACLFVVCLLR